MGFIKAMAVRGTHNKVHRAAFQGMHQQPGESYQAYSDRLKAKAGLRQYVIKLDSCWYEYTHVPLNATIVR